MGEPESTDTQPVWSVEVEHRQTAWYLVQAGSRAEAEEAAMELFDPVEAETEDLEANALTRPRQPEPDDTVWVGGEEGGWIIWGDRVS